MTRHSVSRVASIRASKGDRRIYLEVFGENSEDRLQLKMYTQSDYKALVATAWIDGKQLAEKTIAEW